MPNRDRIAKIKALFNSPVEGERAAARAALDRIPADVDPYPDPYNRPASGSLDEQKIILEWCDKVQFCASRLSSKLLSPADLVLIRNLSRSRIDPWDPKVARPIQRIYERLKEAC